MKTALFAAAIGVAMLTGYGLSAQPAQAAYIVDLTQEGSNVVATGSGTIDLAGLTLDFVSVPAGSIIFPSNGEIITGGPPDFATAYGGAAFPSNFGSGGFTFSSNLGAGDLVGTLRNTIYVPAGYVSGGALSDNATYDSATFASLGIMPGVYVWTWGSGPDADSFTLVIGTAGVVPESSTWAMLVAGFGFLGFLGYRKTRSDNALA
jgi:hypothetical protein